MVLQVFQTVASSQPLFFLDRYDDGPLKSTHWQSQGREASIIVELLKQASVPLCLLISWLLSKWTWICNIRREFQKTLSFLFFSTSHACVHVATVHSSQVLLVILFKGFGRNWFSATKRLSHISKL